MRDDDGTRPDRDVLDDLVGLDEHDVRPDEAERPEDCAVLVLRREDLLLGPDPERADDRVQRGRRVRHEDEVARRRADEGGERRPRLPQLDLELPDEEGRRVALELALEALVLGEDLHRAGPVAAVVEVGDPRVEEKAVAHAA